MVMVSPVDRFLILWLGKGRYKWSRLRRRACEAKYLKVSLPQPNSLDDIATLLKQVKWTMDGPLHLYDSISYPQTVWAKKRDDCDGFAVLAAALLKLWQLDSSPTLVTVMLRPVRSSHTLCVFRASGGILWFFDNGSLRRGDFRTYAEVVAELKGQSKLVCWDVVDPDTLQTLEFHIA
jgi:hypothetical protein